MSSLNGDDANVFNIDKKDYLEHYGIIRRSGRYPWGTTGWGEGPNETPAQRSKSMLDAYRALRREGLTDAVIAQGWGMTSKELRNLRTVAVAEAKSADVAMAQRLREKGMSPSEIGRRMGKNESSVRALLKPGSDVRSQQLRATADLIKQRVEESESHFIDIGVSSEYLVGQSGIPRQTLDAAVARLQDEGYEVHTYKIDQLGLAQQTTVKVVGPPGSTQKEAWMARNRNEQLKAFSDDGGATLYGIKPPRSIKSDRVQVVYSEDGGGDADGVIYVRPGVPEVSIGGNNYAQVRIAVDGTHYLKGMAVYKNDLPPGVDLQFNTDKSKDSVSSKKDAFKEMQRTADGAIDQDNPFGAAIDRQILDDAGNPTSVINIVNDAGQWDEWSRNLPTQMLSKQPVSLAKQQLAVTMERRENTLKEIQALTNPTVRKKLLEDFAEDLDSASVHLKAAAMPGQSTHVLLPVKSIKDNEIYAPNYDDGTNVALVRFPHGGIFEIPELKVNNRNREAKAIIGNAEDAVGINPKVAQRLSGADFDGDTVLVIPNDSGQIKTKPALIGLKDFDPKRRYPAVPGTTFKGDTQQLMGDISNLITDMTIKGANDDEIAAAVRHSMVVIDAEKHNLNYKQSSYDNNIPGLKKRYQGVSERGQLKGASTLISRAKSKQYVDQRMPRRARDGGPVDLMTGEKVYTNTGATYVDAQGRTKPKQTKTTKLAEAKDAFSLVSDHGGTQIERVYAQHSNKLKAMANQARKEAAHTKGIVYNRQAAKAYSKEVASLNAKLRVALQNAPLERQALAIANRTYQLKKQANPDMDREQQKRTKNQALAAARDRIGAKKTRVEVNWDEWNAIQSGAISNHKLTEILRHSDMETIKTLATPKTRVLMTPSKINRAQTMAAQGYTQAEIASSLGVSLSTLKDSL